MMRASWAGLGTITLALVLGCGGSDDGPAAGAGGTTSSDAGKDASSGGGSGGSGGTSAGGSDSGAGGTTSPEAGSGGAPSSGGADAGDAGPPPDTTPPVFGGATGIATPAEDRVEVSWTAATDDRTPVGALSYRVYRAATSGGQDFARGRRCNDPLADAGAEERAALPCFVTTPAGATSALVRDAIPGQEYFYVVRAVDQAGNEDANTAEVHVATPDATPPEFGGVRSVKVVSATSIRVEWGPAWDLATAEPSLTFEVFVNGASSYKSKPGEHSALIVNLTQLTTYDVRVVAHDAAGNTDANARKLSVTTPEGIPPTFDGARMAIATGNAVRVFWAPATDNVTETENLYYEVFQSIEAAADKRIAQFVTKLKGTPDFVSARGASSILIQEPNAGTRYYYVVRARDAAGNVSDVNLNTDVVTVSTAPLPDSTPPTFNGVTQVTSLTPTSVQASWIVATDNVTTAAANMTYLVYVSTTSTVPTTSPWAVVRGATKATLAGLTPSTTYYVLVVARDEAGNLSTGTVTQSGQTLAANPSDTTAPTGTGTPQVTAPAAVPTRLGVTWTAATDDVGTAADIRYHVCLSTAQADCTGSSFVNHIVATTDFGVTTATLNSLVPRTGYFVYVRAEDRAGNVEQADHLAQKATATSWRSNVQSILVNRCIACHDYQDPAVIVNVPGSFAAEPGSATETAVCALHPSPAGGDGGWDFEGCQLRLVEPGRPELSLIYRKVNPIGLGTSPFTSAEPNQYSGLQEPRDTSSKLSGEEDDILRDWITQGAIGN